MNISIILGHPYPESLNHAIAKTVKDTLLELGHNVYYHDLYEEEFNPVLPRSELINKQPTDPLVLQYMQELKEADGLIIIHPNWWGQPPAILKGWVDRVLRNGVGYTFPEGDSGGGLPIGLLPQVKGIVLNTSNTPAEREEEVFGDPLERIWKDCIFRFCGISSYERRMFRVVADSTEDDRKAWLEEASDLMRQHFGQSV